MLVSSIKRGSVAFALVSPTKGGVVLVSMLLRGESGRSKTITCFFFNHEHYLMISIDYFSISKHLTGQLCKRCSAFTREFYTSCCFVCKFHLNINKTRVLSLTSYKTPALWLRKYDVGCFRDEIYWIWARCDLLTQNQRKWQQDPALAFYKSDKFNANISLAEKKHSSLNMFHFKTPQRCCSPACGWDDHKNGLV